MTYGALQINPLEDKGGHRAVSEAATLPAPTKGWYVGNNIADSPPGTAYALTNAFPQLNYVRARRGSAQYAQLLAQNSPVQTLMVYTTGTAAGQNQMFAVCNDKIFDVSAGGTSGAAVVSGLGSNYLEYVQFVNSGGSWLICVDGVNQTAHLYDGSAWQTSPAITGITGSGGLASVWAYQDVLYFAQTGTLDVWYLGLDSIGGAATKFSMNGVFTRGGQIMTGGNYTVTTTNGSYNAWCAITDAGEVAVYSGLNPSDTTWKQTGIHKIGHPLGRRCLMYAGGDLAIIMEDGILPLSQALQLDQAALQQAAVTQPIYPAWRDAVVNRGGQQVQGWQMTIYSQEGMGVMCLPQTSGQNEQFVANARTGAWARYVGYDANCFAVYNDLLYFGTSDGRVCQAEVGGYDSGPGDVQTNYTMTVFPSYSSLGKPGYRKDIKMVRPLLQGNFNISPQITTVVDYVTDIPSPPSATTGVTPGALWDTAVWDTALWPPTLYTQNYWVSSAANGEAVSPILQLTLSLATLTPDVRLSAMTFLFEPGSILG